MLRIGLILSILTGVAALAISHLKVSPRIDTLESDNARLTTDLRSARTQAQQAEEEARDLQNRNEQLESELANTQDQLQEAKQTAVTQRNRADDLQADLTDTRQSLQNAERQLNRYLGTGLSVEQVVNLRDRLREIANERDVFSAENEVLSRRVNQLRAELTRILGPEEQEVELPQGLRGQVVAVDPKWDFVVLDVGSEQGVLKYGKMMVSRDKKLIAKVQISEVMPNRSIANVLPEWKQAEILEGDYVVYY